MKVGNNYSNTSFGMNISTPLMKRLYRETENYITTCPSHKKTIEKDIAYKIKEIKTWDFSPNIALSFIENPKYKTINLAILRNNNGHIDIRSIHKRKKLFISKFLSLTYYDIKKALPSAAFKIEYSNNFQKLVNDLDTYK